MASVSSHRSHSGCWTCKRRRRKCDEGRPTCQKCNNAGLECEGYEQRLRWGAGIASRGHLTGALEPVQESIPPRQKGRRRDLDKEKRRQPVNVVSSSTSDQNPLSPLPAFTSNLSESRIGTSGTESSDSSGQNARCEMLFNEFLATGHLFLYSIPTNDSPVIPMIPRLCKQSETLYNIVVSLQEYLSYGRDGAFFEYYDVALAQFRADLNNPVQQSGDAILISALLLCTIGILQGTPWTVHLKGMENLLKARSQLSPKPLPSSYSTHTIEVMGWMDLPTFVIGRQIQSMNIWRQFRSGKIIPFSKGPDAVEPVSGLPRSLIDLFSYDGDVSTEKAFFLWPGFEGNIAQCHMWEAYRLAGILDLRRRRAEGVPLIWGSDTSDNFMGSYSVTLELPTNKILVARTMSSMYALKLCIDLSTEADSLLASSVLYPLFVLAIEIAGTDLHVKWHDLISEWFQWQIGLNHSTTTKMAWQIIQEVSSAKQRGISSSPDDIAREQGIEIALF